MKQQKLSSLMWLIGAISVFVATSARADADIVEVTARELKKAEVPITEIHQLSEIPHPHTSVKDWLAQDQKQNQVIQVTGVRLSPTASGLEIILETPISNKLQTTTKSEGNTFSVVIFNAQLRLPGSNTFRSDKPIAGITGVVVENQDANSILVTAIGETSLPKAKIFDSNQGLILAIAPETSFTQQQPQPQAPPTDKPSNETPQDKPSATGEEPIELVVTGEREGSYNVPNASTATKIEIPLRDIPQSIQVIPHQIIEDRQAVRVNELTDNVSGVRPIPGYGGLSSAGFYIRGFSQGNENFRNGFRDFGFLSPRNVANIEQIEFLKGPGSVLYGGGAFGVGGVVNTVTKKPLDDPFDEENLTIGSYDFYRPTIDITGPLVGDRSLLYRLNLAYENAGSYRDFNENNNIFVAPAFTWKIDPRTKVTIEFEYQRDLYVSDFGFPFEPESLQLPRNRFLGIPGFNDGNFNGTSITYNFEHEFNKNWHFRQGFNAINVSGDTRSIFFNSLEADRKTLDRYAAQSHEEQENYTLQNEIFGKFNTGSLRHNILVGAELARYRFSYDFLRASIAPINIFNPNYDVQIQGFQPDLAEKYGSDNFGIYFQDFIEILPNLKLLAGGRFDLNDSSKVNRQTDQTDNSQSNSHFSPRVGIVYQPSRTTSLYFNWSNSFNPQFQSRSRTDEQFKPETAEQFEVGVKQELFNNQVSATLAFYQLTRQNVLITDPVDTAFSIQTGEQRSRGIELDMAGQILPGWKIIATYAYTDAIVTKDEIISVGNRLINAPSNSASLWTTYEIQGGQLQGLGFGAGIVYVGEREALLPNTFSLPSFIRTDAAIFYKRDNFKVGLNIKNLFNVESYENNGNGLTPGAPLTLLVTVSIRL